MVFGLLPPAVRLGVWRASPCFAGSLTSLSRLTLLHRGPCPGVASLCFAGGAGSRARFALLRRGLDLPIALRLALSCRGSVPMAWPGVGVLVACLIRRARREHRPVGQGWCSSVRAGLADLAGVSFGGSRSLVGFPLALAVWWCACRVRPRLVLLWLRFYRPAPDVGGGRTGREDGLPHAGGPSRWRLLAVPAPSGLTFVPRSGHCLLAKVIRTR
jgi:hypothetical protein